MESPLNLAGESAGRGRRPVGSGDDAAFDQSGGVHSTGLVVVDGPLGTTGIYGRYGGHLDSDGGVVDALHPSADGGGADATAVVREGSTFTLPLSAAPGAGNYPLTGQTVDWGDGQPDATPTASDTSASHQYTDGGDTDTAQAYAVYGSGTATKSVPANPVAVQVVDVPARLTAVELDGENGDGEVPAGGTAELSAAFTDPGLGEHHQATVDWGDGTTSAATVYDSGTGRGGIDATHVYADSGSYTATLTVTDDAGGTPGDGLSRATVPLDVTYVAPTFGLTAAPTATAGGAGVSLTLRAAGTNAGGVTGWSVDWGDGTTPTVVPGGGVAAGNRYTWPVPPHVYAAAGHYVISATPADQAGPHAAAVGTTVSVAEPAPTNLTATAINDEDVQLTWTPDPAAGTQYEVDRQNSDGTWAAIATVDDSVEGDTYTDSGLSGLQTYAYRVRAVGGTPDLNSVYTAPASATTTLTTPDTPTGLSATESNAGEVDLTWADPSGLATDFDVLRSGDGGESFEQIVDVVATGGGQPTYADLTAVAGTDYQYEVVADDAAGPSDATDPVEADTSVLPPTIEAVHATDDTTVQLSWSDAAGAAADPQYEVDRLTAAGTWAVLGTVDPAAAGGDVYADAGLAPGTTYTYRVRTLGDTAGQDSAYAGPFTAATLQSGPGALSAKAVSQNEIDLSWTASGDPNARATNVYVSTDGVNFSYYDAVPSSATSYQAVGLTAGTRYTFEVAGTDADQDQSTLSNAAAAATNVDPWDVRAAGNPTAAEGGEYQLALSAAPSASAPAFGHWTVDWGDGSAPDTYAAGTATATHVFAPGIDTTIIDATAATADGTSLVVAAPPVGVDLVPLPPSGLTATAASATEVDLGWADASQDADGYAVLRSTDGGATFQQVGAVGPGATAYADTSVDATAGPVYEVEATGVTATIKSAPAVLPAPVPPPAASAGTGMPTLAVAAGPAGTDSAVVSWAYAGTDDTGFELESFDEDGPDNYALIATPGPVGAAGTGSMTVPGLVPGDVYDFRMRADHVGGTASHYTLPAVLSAGTGAVPSLALSFTSLPGYGDQVVRVGWAGAAAGGSVQLQVTGDLYASDGWHTVPDLENQNYPAAYVGSEGDVAGLQGYVDDAGMYGFKQTALYVYRIRGFDAAGHPTAWSQPQSITPSIPLTSDGTIGVGLTAPSPTSIVVSLPEPADGHYGEGRIAIQARGQRQYWADGGYGNYGLGGATSGIGAPIRTTYAGLAPGTTYDVCVYYQEYEGDNVYGDICHGKATITTPGNPGDPAVVPAAPAGLHAVNLGDGIMQDNVELVWQNSPNNEDGFVVQESSDPTFVVSVHDFIVSADVTNFIDTQPASRLPVYYRVCSYRGFLVSTWDGTFDYLVRTPKATAISWFPSGTPNFDLEALSLIPLSNDPPPISFLTPSGTFDNNAYLSWQYQKEYRNILNLQVGYDIDPYSGAFTAQPIGTQNGGYTPVPLVIVTVDVPGQILQTLTIKYDPDHQGATVTLFGQFRLNAIEQSAAAVFNGVSGHGGLHRAAWAWAEITYHIDSLGRTLVNFSGSSVPNQTDYVDGYYDGAYDVLGNYIGYNAFLAAPYGSLGPRDNR